MSVYVEEDNAIIAAYNAKEEQKPAAAKTAESTKKKDADSETKASTKKKDAGSETKASTKKKDVEAKAETSTKKKDAGSGTKASTKKKDAGSETETSTKTKDAEAKAETSTKTKDAEAKVLKKSKKKDAEAKVETSTKKKDAEPKVLKKSKKKAATEENSSKDTDSEDATNTTEDLTSFAKLGLAEPLLKALDSLGYKQPTPVQSKSISPMLDNRDVLAQAQTGTGKTAAFALPILSQIDLKDKNVQALVIAPTRELAIQVAEAFKKYAKFMPGFHVTPIFGGQDYTIQLRSLNRCPQVVVGTPGRLMDQINRKNLSIKNLKTIVLDEADEMLNMGFKEDITWILEQIKTPHQSALFSATIPAPIQKIAQKYLNDPQHIYLKANKKNAVKIEQQYMSVTPHQKFEALTRLLEVEEMQAAILFVRTKSISAELAEKLQLRGYSAAAMNGDMSQSLREKVISRLKKGTLDMVVATDVAARGIDVERITHVINYDMPHDAEAYTHRIGRTGRAGREGKAILFVTNRENYKLQQIERSTHSEIKKIAPPTRDEIAAKRTAALTNKISELIEKSRRIDHYREVVQKIISDSEHSAEDIAAAATCLLEQSNPMPEGDLTVREESFRGDRQRKKPRSSRPGDRNSSDGRRDSRGGGRNDSRSDGRRDSRGGGRNDSRSDGQRDSRGGGRNDSRSDGQRDSRGGGRNDSRSYSQRDSRGGGRNDSRSDGQRDSRGGDRNDSRSYSQRDSRGGGRNDSRSDSQRDSRGGARNDSRSDGQRYSRSDDRNRSDGRRDSRSDGRNDSRRKPFSRDDANGNHDKKHKKSHPPLSAAGNKKASFNPKNKKASADKKKHFVMQ